MIGWTTLASLPEHTRLSIANKRIKQGERKKVHHIKEFIPIKIRIKDEDQQLTLKFQQNVNMYGRVAHFQFLKVV